MKNKDYILKKIKQNILVNFPMPDLTISSLTYQDKLEQFISISREVGAKVFILEDNNMDQLISDLYPQAKNIASTITDIHIKTIDSEKVNNPKELAQLDLAIISGNFGVAENGCIWISQTIRHRVLYFIPEYLVIILDKNNIVHNMHEAYKKINNYTEDFGVFISGPSKTADIEQSLVFGAHGAKEVTIILR